MASRPKAIADHAKSLPSVARGLERVLNPPGFPPKLHHGFSHIEAHLPKQSQISPQRFFAHACLRRKVFDREALGIG